MTTIDATTTHLIVADAAAASSWYQKAFDAHELNRVPLPDGRLIHVELRIGPMAFMLADEFPEHGALGPQGDAALTSVFYLHTDDVDGLWQRALQAGAIPTRPLTEVFWGEREGQLRDPFGYRWGLTQKLRDVPIEEIARTAADVFTQ
jgi:PhnB protein